MVLALAFYVLSFTADEYLSPACQSISKTLKMSESFAGVTLLAFGGGASDLFSSLSAASGGEIDGIEMGISVLLGSSLFCMAGILSLCIVYSPTAIHFNKQFFIRDSLFLIMSLLVLLYAIVVRGLIDMIMSIVFIGMYVVYVVVVFEMDRHYKLLENSEEGQKVKRALEMTELGEISSFGSKRKVSQAEHQRNYDFEG